MTSYPATKIGTVKSKYGKDRTVCFDEDSGQVWVEYHPESGGLWYWHECDETAENRESAFAIARAALRA